MTHPMYKCFEHNKHLNKQCFAEHTILVLRARMQINSSSQDHVNSFSSICRQSNEVSGMDIKQVTALSKAKMSDSPGLYVKICISKNKLWFHKTCCIRSFLVILSRRTPALTRSSQAKYCNQKAFRGLFLKGTLNLFMNSWHFRKLFKCFQLKVLWCCPQRSCCYAFCAPMQPCCLCV